MNIQLLIKIAVLIVAILIGCQKDDNDKIVITEGYYEGFYAYSGDTIWEAISFKTNSFSEQPSGGLPIGWQKWPCLVEGIYTIIDSNIVFKVTKYPLIESQCESGNYLSGRFTLRNTDESLLFWKGEGDQKQTHWLKLLSAGH